MPGITLSEAEIAIASLLRDVRRGTANLRMRQVIFRDEIVPLDQGQMDTLDLVVLDEGCRMAELAEALRVDASTATRAVQRLERDGLVERTRCHEDGRVVRVVATARGRELHDAMAESRRRFLREVFGRFEPAELETLQELLDRLVATFDELAGEEGDPVLVDGGGPGSQP